MDGNKRAGTMVMIAFLRINGHDIRVEKPELTGIILALAASEITEDQFATWLRGHTTPNRYFEVRNSLTHG